MFLGDQFSEIPAWLHDNGKKLDSILAAQHVPHTILFSGSEGVGKSEMANMFSKALLCVSNIKLPCDNCKSCNLFDHHTHGDFLHVSSEDSKNNIGVEQIRNAISFANKTSAFGYRKVILINPAEKLQRNASNALLKLIEEPPANTIALLVSNRDVNLPATVHSRCLRLEFSSPDHQVAYRWLSEKLPNECEFSKTIALSLRQPFKALTLIKTKEFDKLLSSISSPSSESGLDIGLLRSLAQQRDPNKLFLEYLCLQLEKFLKEATKTTLNNHVSKNIFECQGKLRSLIAKIDQGVALNISLNFTNIVNKLIKAME